MSSKQQDVAKPAISPILFMTVEGQPMAFYLRPGPAKSKLQPLITAGAGLVYNVQQPGAILLIDPEEKDDIPEATAHRYVSTQYIVDCIEKDEQLNLEDYRVKSEAAPRQSARLSNKSTSPRYSGGRIGYTPEDDAAILSYVSNHKTGVGGNRLWQEMEKQSVTSHSWQSMKYRYRVRLAKKTPEVVVAVTVEEDNKEADGEIKDEGTDEAVSRGNSTAEDSSSETHSPETNLTQADSKSESAQPEITEAQASALPQVQYVDRQEDEQSAESPQTDDVDPQTDEERAESSQTDNVDPQTDEEQAESSQTDNVDPQTDEEQAESSQEETVEPETSISPQTGPSLDPQTNSHPAEDTEPEEQTITSPKKQRVQQSSPPAEAESLLDTSPQTRSKEKKKASLEPEQPQRSLRRKRSVLDMLCLPESYSKKLRSPPGRPPSPPPPTKKTKLSVKPSPQKVTVVDEPPPKKARAKSVKAAAEREQAAVSETTQADPEPNPEPDPEPDPEPGQEPDPEPGQEPDPEPNQEPDPQPQKVEKKKEKRKLGILELATKEFEDEDESDEDESPDLLNPTEMGTVQPTAAELPLLAAAAASTQSHPEHRGPSLQENHQASCSKSLPETSGPEPTATGATDVTSKVHLFIFDSESQEEESQSILGAKPVVNKDAAPSLTQVQLEEDKQRIRELMSQTNQDLVSVTKALLRTSGDFSAALEQLLNPSSASGTVWNRHDDDLLLSADPMDREQLQEKYGEEGVAKRIVFLEIVT